jgi:hypothetical protein
MLAASQGKSLMSAAGWDERARDALIFTVFAEATVAFRTLRGMVVQILNLCGIL